MATTNSAAIRDVMVTTIAALTPVAPGGGRFVAHRLRGNDFREYCEQNPTFRLFSIRETGPLEGPEVSNLDNEWVTTTFELVSCYPLSNRAGPQMSLDRDDAMELDMRQFDAAIGLVGFAALEAAAFATVMGAPEREREQGQACAFNVLRVRIGYTRATT